VPGAARVRTDEELPLPGKLAPRRPSAPKRKRSFRSFFERKSDSEREARINGLAVSPLGTRVAGAGKLDERRAPTNRASSASIRNG
jgi:hypothetical protein